jgi:protein-S-isoprenylcysteine O-methyltransferase Ste14
MIWLMLSILVWGVAHSLLASLQVKELARRWFGTTGTRFYRLFYNGFAVVSFLPVLGVAVITPDRILYAVRFPWSVLMVLGEILAIVGLVAGVLKTGIWDFLGLQPFMGNEKPARLTITGLYHYIRHPLYAAGLAIIWLLPHMTVNTLVMNIALTIYILVGAFFEERKLRHEFGQEYIDYAAVTPMLIPFTKWNKKHPRSS